MKSYLLQNHNIKAIRLMFDMERHYEFILNLANYCSLTCPALSHSLLLLKYLIIVFFHYENTQHVCANID